MRGLALGGDLSRVSSVRECSRIPWKKKILADTADPPARANGVGPSRSLPRCCPLRVWSFWLLVGAGSVPPSVRKLPSLAVFGKGCVLTLPEGGFSRTVPSGARPGTPSARSVCSLSSTAARASPLRVRGGITRGRALSACRCAEPCGGSRSLVAGGGEGPRTCPRARYPLTPRGVA